MGKKDDIPREPLLWTHRDNDEFDKAYSKIENEYEIFYQSTNSDAVRDVWKDLVRSERAPNDAVAAKLLPHFNAILRGLDDMGDLSL